MLVGTPSAPPATARCRATRTVTVLSSDESPNILDIGPELRAVEALGLRDGAWVELGVFGGTATARIAPFDAIEFEIGRLFLPKEADEF